MSQPIPSTIHEQATDLLQQMTLAEKIGQITQIEKNSITPAEVTQYAVGSVASGGAGRPAENTPQAWRQMVTDFQNAALKSRLGIPIVYGVDAVHGHNNVYGTVIFPHNIALGAANDPALVERIAQITTAEMLATNIHWNFAPAVSVPQDPRWGRTYEGFSDDPEIVATLGAAAVRGIQQHCDGHIRALATAKHFVADGGTAWNTTPRYDWITPTMWRSPHPNHWRIDQGDSKINEETLRAVHLRPYVDAIAAGTMSIMVSYSSWRGVKLHAHKYLLTDVLKGEMGFEGFLISDWMAIDQISADYYSCVVQSINAGLDMIMIPFDYKRFIGTLTQAVENGDVPTARIDDAVLRILRVKLMLGLFDQPHTDARLLDIVGTDEHRHVARKAVSKSLVLLKNDGVLPLSNDTSHIIVAGRGADDIGLQCGGWTIEWYGAEGDITPGTTLLEGIRHAANSPVAYSSRGIFPGTERAPVGVAVLSEPSYAEGFGDSADLAISDQDLRMLYRTRERCEKLVVIVLSGRPVIITDILNIADAVIAAWLPGTEGAGVADVLFGDAPFTGKLPRPWLRSVAQLHDDPLFPHGFGLTL